MDQTQERTLSACLKEAAAEGFTILSNTFEGGRMLTIGLPGEPNLSFSIEWGDEPYAVERIDQHVATYRHRREDDPRIQHELPYEGGY